MIARGRGNVSFGNTLENIQEVKEAQCQDVGYSIVSKNDREQIDLAVDTLSFKISLEKVNLVVDPLKYTDNIDIFVDPFYSTSAEQFFQIPVFVEVDLLPCPVGFQLVRGKCICHQILRKKKHSLLHLLQWHSSHPETCPPTGLDYLMTHSHPSSYTPTAPMITANQ